MKKVLAVLSINPDYIQFAVPELKSMLSQLPIPFETLFKQQLTTQPHHSYEITHETLRNFPYVTLNVPEFHKYEAFFAKACKQSVMLHKFVLLISQGQNYDSLIQNRDEDLLKSHCRSWEETVACDFISRNRVQGRTYQLEKINRILTGMDIRGKIDISKAKKRYQLVEDHCWYQQHHESPPESTLRKVYFGIQLCNNKVGKAKFNSPFELSKRVYLGPTSADNDLAFMMCNQARVEPGSFILDPFVGTGGLIIPPASKGAVIFGCDLDMRVLNGYAVGRINKRSPYYSAEKKLEVFTPKITLNFQQYGFPEPNIFRMDSTKLAFKKQELFDAIITDPPYGLRAMSRSVTGKRQVQVGLNEGNTNQTQIHEIKEVTGEVQVNQSEADFSRDKTNQLTYASKRIQEAQEQDLIMSKIESISIKKTEECVKEEKKTSKIEESIDQTERQKKKEKKQLKKLNRRNKMAQLTQEEKEFKKAITEKLNRQRIDNWDKFDKLKVQCTEREKIFEGLITFARTRLKKGGRLVFLYPIYQEQEYLGAASLPKHEGFRLIDLSENKLSKNNSRILVTLEKESA